MSFFKLLEISKILPICIIEKNSCISGPIQFKTMLFKMGFSLCITHTHTHTYTYTTVYICILYIHVQLCMYMCVCDVERETTTNFTEDEIEKKNFFS